MKLYQKQNTANELPMTKVVNLRNITSNNNIKDIYPYVYPHVNNQINTWKRRQLFITEEFQLIYGEGMWEIANHCQETPQQ